MIVVLTRFPIKPEFSEEYSKHLKEVISTHKVEEQPGYVRLDLLAPKNVEHISNNNKFVIKTVWEDMKSFMAYTQSEVFKESHKNMPSREWFAGQPEVEIYETID